MKAIEHKLKPLFLPPVREFPVRMLLDNNMAEEGFRWYSYPVVVSGRPSMSYPVFSAAAFGYIQRVHVSRKRKAYRRGGDPGDAKVLGEAASSDRIFVTQDWDFAHMVANGASHAGIVLIPGRESARRQACLCLSTILDNIQVLKEKAFIIAAPDYSTEIIPLADQSTILKAKVAKKRQGQRVYQLTASLKR